MRQHPGYFFLNNNCLMSCKGHSLVPVSSTPMQADCHQCFKEENVILFYFALSQGLFLFVSSFIFHKFNVKFSLLHCQYFNCCIMNGTFILLYLTSVSRWLCLILFPRFSIQHAVIYNRFCCLGCLFVIQSVCYK